MPFLFTLLETTAWMPHSTANSDSAGRTVHYFDGVGNHTDMCQTTSLTWPCHLCSLTFSTRGLLNEHLRDHQQQLHRYDPKRDSVEGEPACSHCGLLVTSMDALRYHITKGHCKHFDPRKPVPDVPISPNLKAALLSGRLGPYLREPPPEPF